MPNRINAKSRGFTQHLAPSLSPKAKKEAGQSWPISKLSAGFTTIELLLVAIVVIVLAGLIAVNYKGVREHGRDTARKSDITILQGQVEVYQAETGKYPTLSQLNNAGFRQQYFKDFDAETLRDPSGKSAALVAVPQAKAFAYQTLPAGCTNVGKNICSGYLITATLEQGGTYIKSSP